MWVNLNYLQVTSGHFSCKMQATSPGILVGPGYLSEPIPDSVQPVEHRGRLNKTRCPAPSPGFGSWIRMGWEIPPDVSADPKKTAKTRIGSMPNRTQRSWLTNFQLLFPLRYSCYSCHPWRLPPPRVPCWARSRAHSPNAKRRGDDTRRSPPRAWPNTSLCTVQHGEPQTRIGKLHRPPK